MIAQNAGSGVGHSLPEIFSILRMMSWISANSRFSASVKAKGLKKIMASFLEKSIAYHRALVNQTVVVLGIYFIHDKRLLRDTWGCA